MDKLLKSYGGIDGIIETIKDIMGSGESLYNNAFWTTVIYCLQDYKRLREENKRQKVIDDGWEDTLKIGDRHEMGG